MRWLVAIAALLAAPALADDWTTEQKVVEGVFLTAIIADFNQTLTIAKASDEVNPALGLSPSSGRVRQYFAQATATHFAIAALLPSEWRTKFLYTTTGFQAAGVLRNYRLGYTVRF